MDKKYTLSQALLLLILSLVMSLSLCACSSSRKTNEASDEAYNSEAPAPKEYNIGISDMGSSIYPWFKGTIEGCYKWMDANGDNYNVKFNYDIQDSLSDPQIMSTNLEGMIAEGKDGIILFPTDDCTAVPLMKEGVLKGIKFVLCDYPQATESDDDKVWETCVSHNMYELGATAGNLAIEYLNTLGKSSPLCLFITDSTWGDSSTARYEGFVSTIKNSYPNAEILVIEENTDRTMESTELLVADFLKWDNVSGRTIDLVSGHNDTLVLGAYNAFIADGRTNTKFIGISGDRQVLELISQGASEWLGEVLQDPIELGYQAADAMYHSLVLGEKLPKEQLLTDPLVITSSNISEINWQEWGWIEE